jgi:hypothetical protein
MPTTKNVRKVTLLLPEDLIDRAIAASGAGLTPTIRKGLEYVIASKAMADVRALRGKVKLSIDVDELRHDRD